MGKQPATTTPLAELLATPPPRTRGTCGLTRATETLSPEDARALRAAVMNRAWSTPALARVLAGTDVRLTTAVIERHRGGRCVTCTKAGA